MSNKTKILLTLATLALSTTAPAAAAVQPSALLDAGAAVGDPIAALAIAWPERTAPVVAQRAQALAEILLDRPVEVADLQATLEAADDLDSGWIDSIESAPELNLRYLPEFDELRVLNLALIDDRHSNTDIGEAAAVEIAAATMQQFEERGLLVVGDYTTDFEVSYRETGGGRKDGSETWSRVDEYRITYLRQVNGIPLANSGARISVHASGRLAAIRLGGVQAAGVADPSGALLPADRGGVRARTVDRDTALRNFRSLIPDEAEVTIHWQRILYVLPDDVEQATIEPQLVVAYSLRYLDPLGGETISRRKMVGLSLTDAGAAPVDFTAPSPVRREKVAERPEQ